MSSIKQFLDEFIEKITDFLERLLKRDYDISELSFRDFFGKEINEKFDILSRFLRKKYKVDFVSVFLINEESQSIIISNTNITANFIKNLNIEMPQLRVNKNIISDSKERGIRTRYSIPLIIQDSKYLLLIEAKKYSNSHDIEKAIIKDVYNFKNLVEA